MTNRVILWERIADHGELRAFLREGPPVHLAFELLRDADGRAWTLRIPYDRRLAVADLLRRVEEGWGQTGSLAFDEEGMARLGSERLADNAEVVALLLRQGEEQTFALWRHEELGKSWTWTLDSVFVPPEHAPELITLLLEAIDKAG